MKKEVFLMKNKWKTKS